MLRSRTTTALGALAVLAVAALPLSPLPAGAAGATVTDASGPDFLYGANNPFADAAVAIHGVQTPSGRTNISLEVSGVAASAAGQTFGAHVHVGACSTNAASAGGHYKNAPATTAVEDNEVWLTFTVGADGTASATAHRDWVFTSSARSVVFHAPGSTARLACTDVPFHA